MVYGKPLGDHGLTATDLVDHEVPIRERQVSRTRRPQGLQLWPQGFRYGAVPPEEP